MPTAAATSNCADAPTERATRPLTSHPPRSHHHRHRPEFPEITGQSFRNPQDRQFGRQKVLHLLFAQRVGALWSLSPFTDTLEKFSDVTCETTSDVDAGLRRVLQEVWP